MFGKSGDIFGCDNGSLEEGYLLAFIGQRTGILLNVLQCVVQTLQQKTDPVQYVSSAKDK